jgi:CRISPR-associated protein Cmr3
MKRVLIKPLEPLMFRSQGEFEPLITGSHTAAQSLIIPRPSTIAGMLGYIKFNNRDKKEDWLTTLTHQLKDVNIYGTLVESNESYFYPLRMGNLFALIDSNTLCSLPKIFESTGESYENWEKEIYDIFYSEKNKLFELINFQDRVGISLDRQKKIVKEHYLYTARYLSFKKEVNYVIFVKGNLNLEGDDGKTNEIVVNFGGEGRVVKIEVQDHCDVRAKDLSGDYYLALSPILIPDCIIDDILEDDLIVMGKVDKISLGFDIAHHRRKEMLTAILEGSVIKKDLVEKYNIVVSSNPNYKTFLKYEKIGYNTISKVDCSKLEVRKILTKES